MAKYDEFDKNNRIKDIAQFNEKETFSDWEIKVLELLQEIATNTKK